MAETRNTTNHHRRPGATVLAGGVCVLALAAVAVGVATRASGDDEQPGLRAAVAARGENARESGGLRAADARISLDQFADDASFAARIERARWTDPDGLGDMDLGSAPDIGALEFPPGVSYPEAATRMLVAAVLGKAPRGARSVPGLPPGKIAVIPAGDDASVVIDLRAPFGYAPNDAGGGRIMLPSAVFDSPAQAAAAKWRRFGTRGRLTGARVNVKILPSCMRMASVDDAPGPVCGVGDIAIDDTDLLRGPRMP